MKIFFNGRRPYQNYYRIGVQNNNLVDTLEFIINNNIQEGKDLTGFKPFLKIVNESMTYIDKIPLTSEFKNDSGEIILKIDLSEYATSDASIDVQLEFLDLNAENDTNVRVWQTNIINIAFEETLLVDKIIQQKEPTILRNHEYRLNEIENKLPYVIIVNSILELPLIGKENTLYVCKETDEIYCFDLNLKQYTLISNNYNNIEIVNGNT